MEASAKAVILPVAERMTPEGQNLLLKIIQEPPEDTFFILTCTNR